MPGTILFNAYILGLINGWIWHRELLSPDSGKPEGSFCFLCWTFCHHNFCVTGLLDASNRTGIKFKITMKLVVIALLSCPTSLVASNLPFGKWSSAPGSAFTNRQVSLSGRDGRTQRNLGMGKSKIPGLVQPNVSCK
jgi:hypothetical protein